MTLFTSPTLTYAQTSCQWKFSKTGNYANQKIDEISGIAHSNNGRWRFLVNDSGSAPLIYVQDQITSQIYPFNVPVKSFTDVEDLSVGRCQSHLFKNEAEDILPDEECLYIADIGDNRKKRSNINLYVLRVNKIEEHILKNEKKYGHYVPTVKMHYPQSAKNAEGFSINPLRPELGHILSKTTKGEAELFTVNLNLWEESKDLALEKIAALPIVDKLKSKKIKTSDTSITSMDIAPQGNKILFLTYGTAFELKINMETAANWNEEEWKDWFQQSTFEPIKIENLEQQESIAYGKNENEFFYTTESKKKAPLVQANCI